MTKWNRKLWLSLHYNVSNSFLFVNAPKIHKIKAKDSEIKKYLLCLAIASVDFSAIKIIKILLNRNVHDFAIVYRAFDTSNIINIHKYLMKKHDIK